MREDWPAYILLGAMIVVAVGSWIALLVACIVMSIVKAVS